MTDRATLEALLARVLEGEGPDRALDARIYILTTVGSAADADYAATDPEVTCKPPRYTASLDAALTLVPKGWRYELDSGDDVECAEVRLTPDCAGQRFEGHADTLIRALIAACLKARMEAQGE